MREERRNKGFSLVELIIVIAIMLVLVGILAPQFVKYVQRSRVAADMASAQELAEAIQAALADGGSINGVSITGRRQFTVVPGDPIQGLDGISTMPVSKINKENVWFFACNPDGEVFVGVVHPDAGGSWIGVDGWRLYPDYGEDWEYPFSPWPWVK